MNLHLHTDESFTVIKQIQRESRLVSMLLKHRVQQPISKAATLTDGCLWKINTSGQKILSFIWGLEKQECAAHSCTEGKLTFVSQCCVGRSTLLMKPSATCTKNMQDLGALCLSFGLRRWRHATVFREATHQQPIDWQGPCGHKTNTCTCLRLTSSLKQMDWESQVFTICGFGESLAPLWSQRYLVDCWPAMSCVVKVACEQSVSCPGSDIQAAV